MCVQIHVVFAYVVEVWQIPAKMHVQIDMHTCVHLNAAQGVAETDKTIPWLDIARLTSIERCATGGLPARLPALTCGSTGAQRHLFQSLSSRQFVHWYTIVVVNKIPSRSECVHSVGVNVCTYACACECLQRGSLF
jgi:hypothetical protein